MQPGWLAGRHDEQAMSIDLRPLAERAGCRYIQADIKRIDAAARTIELTDGRSETWEALSLARSSIPCDARVPGAAEFTVPIRPMARAREIMPAVERAQQVFDKREIRIAVVGASGRGFETACALRARLLRDGTSATIMLVDGESQLLPRCPAEREVTGGARAPAAQHRVRARRAGGRPVATRAPAHLRRDHARRRGGLDRRRCARGRHSPTRG